MEWIILNNPKYKHHCTHGGGRALLVFLFLTKVDNSSSNGGGTGLDGVDARVASRSGTS